MAIVPAFLWEIGSLVSQHAQQIEQRGLFGPQALMHVSLKLHQKSELLFFLVKKRYKSNQLREIKNT